MENERGLTYTVILTAEADPDFKGYFNASVPALPGCFSYGHGRAEALENITEAIVLYLEDLEAEGLAAPLEELEQLQVAI